MITVIGIPFGIDTMRLGILALWPFGSHIVDKPQDGGCLNMVMNVLWFFVGGFWIALTHLGFGLLLCITTMGQDALPADATGIGTLREGNRQQ